MELSEIVNTSMHYLCWELKGSTPNFKMCGVEWGASHTTKQFLALAGCPTIQLSSDCLPGDSIRSHGSDPHSYNIAPTLDTSCKFSYFDLL